MIVLGLNRIGNWCQVLSNGRKYTCRLKEIDGKLFFYFKKEYHPLMEYLSDTAHELVSDRGKVIFKQFKN